VATHPLAAELAAIREMASQITRDGHTEAECVADLGHTCTGHDAERLADVAEVALTLADEWHLKAMGIGEQMDISDAVGAKAGFMMCTAQAYENCSKALTSAITTALLGEVPDGDGS